MPLTDMHRIYSEEEELSHEREAGMRQLFLSCTRFHAVNAVNEVNQIGKKRKNGLT